MLKELAGVGIEFAIAGGEILYLFEEIGRGRGPVAVHIDACLSRSNVCLI